jgi:hypothetical protein
MMVRIVLREDYIQDPVVSRWSRRLCGVPRVHMDLVYSFRIVPRIYCYYTSQSKMYPYYLDIYLRRQ